MKRIQLRWALPIFHLAMDSILVALMVIAANSEPELQRMIRSGQMVMDTPPCPPCRLLAASVPPGSILASRFSGGSSEEIGWISDRGQTAVLRWCLALVAIRIVEVALVGSRYRGVGWSLQVFFWVGAAVYAVISGTYRLAQRTRSRRG